MSIFTTVYAAAVIGGASFFLVWIDSPYVRHTFAEEDYKCSVNQIAKLPVEQVDMLAIGSSRVRAGMNLSVVSSHSNGAVVSPYNFARSGINPLRNYVILRDLLERGVSPTYAYVEVSTEAFADDEINRHIEPFVDVGILKFADVFRLFEAYKHAPFLQRLHIVAASLLKKIGDTLIYVGDGRIWAANSGLSEDAPRVCWRPNYDEKSKTEDAAIERGRREYEKEFGDLSVARNDVIKSFSTPSADLELYSFGLVRSLAHANDIKLISSRHWAAYEPPISEQSLSLLRERVPEFVYPSASFVRSTWGDFADATHMYKTSRQRYSEWLAAQLFGPGDKR
jgi:hypothetical protein